MHFFKSLKGNRPETAGSPSSSTAYGIEANLTDEQDSSRYGTNRDKAPTSPPIPYSASLGPSPGRKYDAPSPAREEYGPPPGPPPGRSEYAPPPGPPPSHNESTTEPPQYHDWTSIPDIAMLPPPPALGNEMSPFSNANRTDADRAHNWCKLNPLVNPHQPTRAQIACVKSGDVRVLKPQEYDGDLHMVNTGVWKGSTRAGSRDASLISSTPLYFACSDSPRNSGIAKTVYFEIKVQSLGRGRGTEESSLAIGYCGVPYPTWRMPGWERASIAVHSDDGRRYVNDSWGGKDFTSSFKKGDTVGLGMVFSKSESPPEYGALSLASSGLQVEIFFTRNGVKDGSWNLHEELDADNDLGVDGLEGQYDLYGVVGTFGGVEFDVFFNRRDWLWQPS